MSDSTIAYYEANKAVIYPSANAVDIGKLNVEENVRSIVTRITNKNYVLHEGDFEINITTVNGLPSISITSGSCNIAGYHLITTDTLYLSAPATPGDELYIGLKLAKDRSDHVLGDETDYGIAYLNGVWASYFTFEEIENDPEMLVLGKVKWDGSEFSELVPNDDLLTRIDSSGIKVVVHDDKHPAISNITLQQLVDYLPDWYVSKLGDDIFGDLYFRIPGDTTNYGILETLEGNTSSKIIVKPNNKDEEAYRAILGANGTHPYLQLSDALIDVTSNNLGILSSLNTNINSVNGDINASAKNHVKLTSRTGNTILDIYNKIFEFDSTSSPDTAGFDLSDATNMIFFLSEFEIMHNDTNKVTTISNDGNILFNPYTIFDHNIRVNNTLYLNGTDTYLNNTQWHLATTNPTDITNTGINTSVGNNGASYGHKVTGNYGNSMLWQYGLDLVTTNASYTPIINFRSAGQSGITTTLYKVSNQNRLKTNGDFYADGNISAAKVFNAVYNDIAEFMEKEDYDEIIEPGDVVYFTDSGKVTKYHEGINPTAIAGVVSSEETYGYALGGDGLEDNQKVPVALKGRVYVKTDNTNFKAGDLIAVDSCGCVYKGDINTHGFYTLGIATKPEKDGKVFMMIK